MLRRQEGASKFSSANLSKTQGKSLIDRAPAPPPTPSYSSCQNSPIKGLGTYCQMSTDFRQPEANVRE